MKYTLSTIVLFLLFSATGYCQTLWLPFGSSDIGDSPNYNVGIGINNPSAKLHVFGAGEQVIFGDENHITMPALKFWGGHSSGYAYIQSGGAAPGKLRITKFQTSTGSLDDLQIYSAKSYFSGDIGIGITSPSYSLHIKKTTGTSEVRTESYDHYAKIGSSSAGGYIGATNGNGDLTVNIRGYGDVFFNTGKFGIGTTNPADKLEVKGNVIRITDGNNSGLWNRLVTNSDGTFSIKNPTGVNHFVIKQDKIGIGTNDPKNKLSVNGTIWAKEVKVSLTDAADWVFEDDYKLKSLDEVEFFVKLNKHLPDVPSADEFRENDLNVAEMDNKLLQKIEELTLYMIDMNKRMNQLETENTQLKEKVQSLENN